MKNTLINPQPSSIDRLTAFEAKPDSGPKSYRILVVDDVADNLFLLQTFLETEEFAVDVADHADAALEIIQAFPPDLILMDVMMPDVNGYELTRKIRRDRAFCSIPIVLITASVEACRIKGIAAGATDFIRKPVDLEDLLTIIERLLQLRNSQSSHYAPPAAGDRFYSFP